MNAPIEHKNDKTDRPSESRAKQYKDAKRPAPYVELDAGGYFMALLYEAGPTKPHPMGGQTPLEWADIHAYMTLSMDDVEPWEASLLRRMSQAYALGLDEGKSPFSIAPVDRD